MIDTPVIPDDVQQLRRARRDPQAFADFYGHNAERVYAFLLRHTRDAQTAADLTAETFAIALEQLRGFRGDRPGAGVAWVFGIARNLVRRWHHDRRVENDARVRLGMSASAWVPDEVAQADNRMDAEALSLRLADAVADLPPGLRDALRLHVLEDLSHREVAEALGISEPNARLRITRALRRMKTALATAEEDR